MSSVRVKQVNSWLTKKRFSSLGVKKIRFHNDGDSFRRRDLIKMVKEANVDPCMFHHAVSLLALLIDYRQKNEAKNSLEEIRVGQDMIVKKFLETQLRKKK